MNTDGPNDKAVARLLYGLSVSLVSVQVYLSRFVALCQSQTVLLLLVGIYLLSQPLRLRETCLDETDRR